MATAIDIFSMIILQDTKEKTPLEFEVNEYITGIEKRNLNVGDYAAEFKDGYRPPIVFERKTIADLFSTLTSNYDRFKREIIRAQERKINIIIIIDGTLYDIWNGCKFSKVSGISIVRKLFTLWIRHGIKFVCCQSKEEMADYIIEFFTSVGKEYVRNKKYKKKEK